MAGNAIKVVFHDHTFQTVYDDALADVLPRLGTYEVKRASHVEPHPDGGWIADMRPSGGPVLLAPNGAPFALRAHALDAERAWLSATWGL